MLGERTVKAEIKSFCLNEKLYRYESKEGVLIMPYKTYAKSMGIVDEEEEKIKEQVQEIKQIIKDSGRYEFTEE